jgi:hypothetical protein
VVQYQKASYRQAGSLQGRHETWQREVANARDERARQDELTRSLLAEVVTVYNAVKRERRLLRAELSQGTALNRQLYTNSMLALNDLQLRLEHHKRLTAHTGMSNWSAPSTRSPALEGGPEQFQSLSASLGVMESYLSPVLEEYETLETPHDEAQGIPVGQLCALVRFTAPAKDPISTFKGRFSAPLEEDIEVLQVTLARPLLLPAPN